MNHMLQRSRQQLALQNFAYRLGEDIRKAQASGVSEWKLVALSAQLKELEALIASQ